MDMLGYKEMWWQAEREGSQVTFLHRLYEALEEGQDCVRMCVRRKKTGAPGAIPTRDLPLRRRTLYAAELREHMCEDYKY